MIHIIFTRAQHSLHIIAGKNTNRKLIYLTDVYASTGAKVLQTETHILALFGISCCSPTDTAAAHFFHSLALFVFLSYTFVLRSSFLTLSALCCRHWHLMNDYFQQEQQQQPRALAANPNVFQLVKLKSFTDCDCGVSRSLSVCTNIKMKNEFQFPVFKTVFIFHFTAISFFVLASCVCTFSRRGAFGIWHAIAACKLNAIHVDCFTNIHHIVCLCFSSCFKSEWMNETRVENVQIYCIVCSDALFFSVRANVACAMCSCVSFFYFVNFLLFLCCALARALYAFTRAMEILKSFSSHGKWAENVAFGEFRLKYSVYLLIACRKMNVILLNVRIIIISVLM